jgi:stage IV sporulation protein FB
VIFAEPEHTDYDLHFPLLGIPVRVHPMFWLMTLILGATSSNVRELFFWILACFVSILLHELGHSLAMRWHRIRSSIVLYSFGGLSIPEGADAYEYHGVGTGGQVFISFAGPATGFLFAVVLVGLIYLVCILGHRGEIYFTPLFDWLPYPKLMPYLVSQATKTAYLASRVYQPSPIEYLLSDLFRINIYWGLLNLLPVLPLDGGHISRDVCQAISSREGIRWSYQISMVVAGGIAAICAWTWFRSIFHHEATGLQGLLINNSLFLAALFGYLAYQSYLTLQAYRSHRGW